MTGGGGLLLNFPPLHFLDAVDQVSAHNGIEDALRTVLFHPPALRTGEYSLRQPGGDGPGRYPPGHAAVGYPYPLLGIDDSGLQTKGILCTERTFSA
jgi:hypothetical protein